MADDIRPVTLTPTQRLAVDKFKTFFNAESTGCISGLGINKDELTMFIAPDGVLYGKAPVRADNPDGEGLMSVEEVSAYAVWTMDGNCFLTNVRRTNVQDPRMLYKLVSLASRTAPPPP